MEKPKGMQLGFLIFVSMAAAASSQPWTGEGAIEERVPKWPPVARGMGIFYEMQKGFLRDMIQTRTVGELMTEYNISTLDDFDEDFLGEWSSWVPKYALGYAIPGAIGILLVLVLPIAGCSICGCWTCTCCCACCVCDPCQRKGKMPVKGDKWECKRVSLSVSLAAITAVLIASVVCSFVALEQIRQEVDPETGALETVLQGFYTLDQYLDDTEEEIDQAVNVGLILAKNQTVSELSNFPNNVTKKLGELTNVLPSLDDLKTFADDLPTLNDSLREMDALARQLQIDADNLGENLTEQQRVINGMLEDCLAVIPDLQLCEDLKGMTYDLRVQPNYTNLYNVTQAAEQVASAIESGVIDGVTEGSETFWEIAAKVEAETWDEIGKIIGGLDSMDESVGDAINSLSEGLATLNLTDTQQGIWYAKTVVDEYGMYIYYGLIAFSSLTATIVFCYIMGIALGLACVSPNPKSKSCDRTSLHGSKFLFAGLGLSFVFSWLFMIYTVAAFIAGGAVENNACRHLVIYDESMDKLEGLLYEELDLPYNVSFKHTMLACEQNQSLYVAVDAENNLFNITDEVDLGKYDIYDYLDELRQVTVTLDGDIDFMQHIDDETLRGLSYYIKSIDFSSYYTELQKNITAVDLGFFANQMNKIADELASEDRTLSEEFDEKAKELLSIRDGVVADMETTTHHLLQNVSVANEIAAFDINGTLDRLVEAEDTLNEDGDEFMKDSLDWTCDSIETTLENFSSSIDDAVRNDIGNCGSLFQAGTEMADAVCVYALDPFNATWFCMGWFIIFNIIAAALANELAYIFRVFGRSNKVVHDESVLDPPFSLKYNEGYMTSHADPEFNFQYADPDVPPSVPLPPVSVPYSAGCGSRATRTSPLRQNKVYPEPTNEENEYLRSGEGPSRRY